MIPQAAFVALVWLVVALVVAIFAYLLYEMASDGSLVERA